MSKQAPLNLFVIEPMGSGGMIHYAYQLCSALAAKGAEVTLVTTSGYELADFPHNFRVLRTLDLWQMFDPNAGKGARDTVWGRLKWTVRRVHRGAKLVWAWVELTRLLLAEKPDLVQFGKINFPFEALFLRYLRWRGLTLTQVCHEFESRESGKWVAKIVRGLNAGIFTNFTHIFLHGKWNQAHFLQLHDIPPDRTHLIEHGNENLFYLLADTKTDFHQKYGIAADNPVILFFGNLVPSKGIPELLDAFEMVYQVYPNARLVIAGYPSKHIHFPTLKQTVVDKGLEKGVIFDPRYIPFAEVGALMQLARCVVYPYRTSTQSGSLQVAYSFGRPVVATRVGGLPDVVENGRSGYLVEPDSPGQLAMALLELVSDPLVAEEMGQYARYLSETRFAWERVAERILNVYCEIPKVSA